MLFFLFLKLFRLTIYKLIYQYIKHLNQIFKIIVYLVDLIFHFSVSSIKIPDESKPKHTEAFHLGPIESVGQKEAKNPENQLELKGVQFMWTAFYGTVNIDRMAQQQSNTQPSADIHEVEQLVHKARTGNRFAFNQLIHIFQNDVFKMVFYRTRSQMDAEDLTQDIFLQAFKNLSRLKSVEKFKSWLFSIAINRIRDFYRKKKLRDMFSADYKTEEEMNVSNEHIHSQDVLDDIYKKDFWRKIESILIRLSTMEREVFTLRFMDNLNINEISGVLGKSESTIKTHLYRALAKFKKESAMLQQFKEVLQ